ncbi:uncharacterized protein BDR25DRAFT_358984 [Lindgomyces ingoldianus]|uniref:Uncharacterized protein n=1 Tax=Lindgomyces ingoldianus TaxID=673940 RepID=A0ACB6QIU5_9PLEO|nr:uncharacterized protein BDR25DRAFT_358984 [Lindgomyces ingoldianus]KAF2466924.1 hypothetical protein BDR25DRAFT_358984 [Lindgomyces ingoldianus]
MKSLLVWLSRCTYCLLYLVLGLKMIDKQEKAACVHTSNPIREQSPGRTIFSILAKSKTGKVFEFLSAPIQVIMVYVTSKVQEILHDEHAFAKIKNEKNAKTFHAQFPATCSFPASPNALPRFINERRSLRKLLADNFLSFGYQICEDFWLFPLVIYFRGNASFQSISKDGIRSQMAGGYDSENIRCASPLTFLFSILESLIETSQFMFRDQADTQVSFSAFRSFLFLHAFFSKPLTPTELRELALPTQSHPLLVGGNISEITSWTLTSLSYGILGSLPANSTSFLQYLCTNFSSLTSRYVDAFPITNGDITAFAKSAICDAAANPSTSPVVPEKVGGNAWYLKSYLAGIFTIQTYHGYLKNSTYMATMCYYLEETLLNGLWLPNYDIEPGSGVDVEGSFCASAGYYDRGPGFTYTNATVGTEVHEKATSLVSEFLARVLVVVLKDEEWVRWVCEGKRAMGLDEGVARGVVCGEKEQVVVGVEEARRGLWEVMGRLFEFQLFHAGNERTYMQYLCENLKEVDLGKVGLDGVKIRRDACAAWGGSGSGRNSENVSMKKYTQAKVLGFGIAAALLLRVQELYESGNATFPSNGY